jgi:flagella basal body P-ring formation protein FlgA
MFVMADPALHPLDDIQRTAHAFLTAQHRDCEEPAKIRLQPLDPRLRLPKCQAALEAFLPSGARTAGNTSIGVRCPDAKPWTLYLSANIRIHDQVLVAKRFLRRGTILSAADFQPERRELSTLPSGYETDPQQLIGRQLQRALMAGKVISPRVVKIPPAVRRGETVTLIAEESGFEITSSGIEQARDQNEVNGAIFAASRSHVEQALAIISGCDPLELLYDHDSRKVFSHSGQPIAKV